MAEDSNDEGNLEATHVLSPDEVERELEGSAGVEPSGAPTHMMFPTDGVDPKADTFVPFPEPDELEDEGPATHIERIPATDKLTAVSGEPAPNAAGDSISSGELHPSGPDTHVVFPSAAEADFEPSGPMTAPVPNAGVHAQELMGLEESSALEDGTLNGFVLEGRFQIDSLIGEGGMGRVYKGTQLSVERPVAIKVLHRSVSQDEAVRRRFMREAKLISSFTHPNTVRLYDFGETEGHLFIAMEYVEGVPLSDLLRDGLVSMPFAFEVIDQVCGSLVEAHKADVVHRDVKPANIVLGRSPDDRLQVKLLDFGIAHIDPENDGSKDTLEDLTKRGAIVGTPEYMAPEQARGKVVSAATDVYSLGVVLYQLVSGELPIGGGSQLETLFWQVTKEPTPITDYLPNCPSQVQRLVERFLQKEPGDRVPSASEVRSALRKAREQLEIPRLRELPDGPIEEVLRRFAREDVVVKMRAHVPETETISGAAAGSSASGSDEPDSVESGEASRPAASPNGGVAPAPARPSHSKAPAASTAEHLMNDERGKRLLMAAGLVFGVIVVVGVTLGLLVAAAGDSESAGPDPSETPRAIVSVEPVDPVASPPEEPPAASEELEPTEAEPAPAEAGTKKIAPDEHPAPNEDKQADEPARPSEPAKEERVERSPEPTAKKEVEEPEATPTPVEKPPVDEPPVDESPVDEADDPTEPKPSDQVPNDDDDAKEEPEPEEPDTQTNAGDGSFFRALDEPKTVKEPAEE